MNDVYDELEKAENYLPGNYTHIFVYFYLGSAFVRAFLYVGREIANAIRHT